MTEKKPKKPTFRFWTDFKRNPFMWIVGDPKIGENTWIGAFTVIDASGGLKIGRDCSISCGTQIYTHDMVEPGKNGIIRRAPVRIGNTVYVGANAVIMKGSVIEDNAVIGAGAIVLAGTHIKRGEVWVGNPARLLKKGGEENGGEKEKRV